MGYKPTLINKSARPDYAPGVYGRGHACPQKKLVLK